MKPQKRLITSRQVLDRLGYRAPSSLWQLRKRYPNFPKPAPFSARTNRYVEDEIDAWIADHVNASRAKEAKNG